MSDPVSRLVAVIEAVLHHKMSVSDFANWLYSGDDAALLLDADYDRLLSLDYRTRDAAATLDRILLLAYQHLRPDDSTREYLRRLLCQLAYGSIDLKQACAELAYYRKHGHEWIPITFSGLDSELDAVPEPTQYHLWNPEVLARELRAAEPWVQQYHQMAKAEAQRVLETHFPDIACS